MNHKLIIVLAAIVFITGCKTSKNTTTAVTDVVMDEIEVVGKKYPYRAAATKHNDLLHTKLEVSFDWEKQHLFGKATLTLSPYFYATNELVLDAKGMELKRVQLWKDSTLQDLSYTYDNSKINITLDKEYKRTEEYTIYIEYVSKPNELEKAEGLSAISDDKGLYFINPLGEDKEKPRQIWTQGEPESNSVWFPTIDHPNERCTQEIYITVEKEFLAMSNGVMVSDTDNGNGTHTVYWKQDKPHAPYLFMMTIGDFAHIKDEWKGMSVDYFVEYEYENVAQEIFGNTPEMLSFFSEQLGVEYQWDKYWQVCVRDYVSGAMENTSAVIFGEFVQRDERELLDEDHEDIVSHELYHHWFGDLVTCESWANLPLNESFATYGEVLWREYKYGADAKGRKVYEDMQGYFSEAARGKQVDMIRYYHDTAEDMFDGHSYAKGGTILNMLRTYVGDDAFFESLKLYLNDNKFQSVEIHNLRLAFEETTGEDLNWFFNQWFLSSGHPVLTYDYTYTEDSVKITIKQEASSEPTLTYQLPMAIDIYEGNTYNRNEVVVDQKEQTFAFAINSKPLLVNVDAEKSTLAQVIDNKTTQNWIFQYMNGKNFMDKLTALEALSASKDNSEAVLDVYRTAMANDYWYLKAYAIDNYPITIDDEKGITILEDLAEKSEKSDVQASAILKLSELELAKFEPIYENGLKHQSYLVNAASLEALSLTNLDKALAQATEWEDNENFDLKDAVAYIFSEYGGVERKPYFEKSIQSDNYYESIYGVYYYSKFLGRMDNETALEGIATIENFGKTDEGSFSKNVALSGLKRIQTAFSEQAAITTEVMNDGATSKSQKLALESELQDYNFVILRAQEGMDSISNMMEE